MESEQRLCAFFFCERELYGNGDFAIIWIVRMEGYLCCIKGCIYNIGIIEPIGVFEDENFN